MYTFPSNESQNIFCEGVEEQFVTWGGGGGGGARARGVGGGGQG